MRRWIILALVTATAIKLLLAWFTIGSSDVATWREFADNSARCGSCAYYLTGPYGDPFNHPPFIILFLKLIAGTSAFPFWLRLPGIVADIGSVILVMRLLPKLSTAAVVLLALNPVSILVSGFHGNTDPVMICFVLAAIYASTKNKWAIAGVAYGMALNIKVVPLILLACFLLYRTTYKNRLVFSGAVVAAFLLPSLLYIDDWKVVIANVFGYRGLFVNWGLAHYFDVAGAPLHMLAAPLTYAILIGSWPVSWWFNRTSRSLFETCAAVVLMFYVLTPTLGLQYLAWGAPFVILLGTIRASLYYGLGGALMALHYHRWSQGQWYFADSHLSSRVTAETEFLSFALWVTCGFLFYILAMRNAARSDP